MFGFMGWKRVPVCLDILARGYVADTKAGGVHIAPVWPPSEKTESENFIWQLKQITIRLANTVLGPARFSARFSRFRRLFSSSCWRHAKYSSESRGAWCGGLFCSWLVRHGTRFGAAGQCFGSANAPISNTPGKSLICFFSKFAQGQSTCAINVLVVA